MIDLTKEHLYYGGAAHRPPEIRYLKAGPLRCQYEAGYLRYVRAGSTEVLRMIYPAVRDHNWGTVAPQISHETVNIGEDRFEIRYESLYREGEVHFRASYQIRGDAEGNIMFALAGEALSTFRKNRIGFNVLHPAEIAGSKYEVVHSKGGREEGRFPEMISPRQPVMDIKSLHWEVDGIWVEVDFEGDVFEMEDQRNWTDASFKTYSTPLALPFPVTLKKGTKLQQKVSLKLKSKLEPANNAEERIELKLGKETFSLPAIGIAQSSEVEMLTEQDLALLSQLNFSHYRVDLNLNDNNLVQKWKRISRESRQLGLPLELALHFGFESNRDLGKLKDLLSMNQPPVRQILVFSQQHKSTPDSLIAVLLPKLRAMFPGVAIGAGTDCFFAELNRERIKNQELDFLTYSINPQVHQFDNQSLIETLQAQTYTLESARNLANGKAVHISPITLKMRFNPNATGPEPETPEGALPPQVDTRQMSLFGAGWTMSSIKYLTEHNLVSVVYFETTGRRGILPGAHSPTFPDQQKAFYPMYWVLYHLLRHRDIQIITSDCGNPLQISSIAWSNEPYLYLMVANLQIAPEEVHIMEEDYQWEQMVLTAASFSEYADQPDKWGEGWLPAKPRLELEPYALYLLRGRR